MATLLDPEVVARKVAAMSLARAQAREVRLAAETALLSDVTALDLEGLRRRASMRQWLCALGEATGATEPEIARLVGLRGGKVSVHRLKQHPVTRRLVELIQRHQLERVLKGEFGAQATAKAAAPAVVEHLTELAGAQRECDGTRRGRASRDRDAIAAGQVVLDVAGVRVVKHQHQHLHMLLLEEMTDGELERFAADGTCPERLQGALGAPGEFTGSPALPAPAVNGAAGGPRTSPRPSRISGGR